ncbi:AraC family transcriptional regulator [Egibacter rhizosphaerae]|uniref:AraC family transcriptional regulator n=1 Tax=Egibacter rhizosphaerae TaxID=1670831 RepID=A0A411YCC2_9ACTN|nr:helix-turn-helix domain-containing protein [Egibacter rhizosphaerae]QBI18838.1 AraC family transcriptional regulator [Egibacter rhizosphaerae]
MTLRLAEARSWAERYAVADSVLTDRFTQDPGPDPRLDHAWHRLSIEKGRGSLPRLADQLGWSSRHLARRFADGIGLAPSTAARLVRFETAAAFLQAPAAPTWAEVAASSGYADQPHLIRDVRDFAHTTPGRLRTEVVACVPQL